MISAILIITITIFAICIMKYITKLKLLELNTQYVIMEDYYSTANKVMKNDKIKKEHKELILFLNKTINKEEVLLVGFLSLNKNRKKHHSTTELLKSNFHKDISRCLALWLLSTSYRSIILGRLLRANMTNLILQANKQQTSAVLKERVVDKLDDYPKEPIKTAA